MFAALGSGLSLVETVVRFLIGCPAWAVCHALRLRGPRAAIAFGGVCGFALSLGGLTRGFGLFGAPPSVARTRLFSGLSGLATSAPLSPVCAFIGWAIWRVADRRTGDARSSRSTPNRSKSRVHSQGTGIG